MSSLEKVVANTTVERDSQQAALVGCPSLHVGRHEFQSLQDTFNRLASLNSKPGSSNNLGDSFWVPVFSTNGNSASSPASCHHLVALIIWLAWRISRIAKLFAYGKLTVGKVTDLRIAKDRGRLEFEFEYHGKSISTWSPIHKTKPVLSLTPGTAIEVLFDTSCPTRAIVKDLYAA